jgi:hypothetical protein
MPSTANPVTATSAASAQPSAPLLFRSEAADPGFPWAGAALLIVLVLVAIAARWHTARRGAAASTSLVTRWLSPRLLVPGAPAADRLRVLSTIQLDAHAQLHTVEWAGRHLLLATSPHAAPVLIDRVEAPASPVEHQP